MTLDGSGVECFDLVLQEMFGKAQYEIDKKFIPFIGQLAGRYDCLPVRFVFTDVGSHDNQEVISLIWLFVGTSGASACLTAAFKIVRLAMVCPTSNVNEIGDAPVIRERAMAGKSTHPRTRTGWSWRKICKRIITDLTSIPKPVIRLFHSETMSGII